MLYFEDDFFDFYAMTYEKDIEYFCAQFERILMYNNYEDANTSDLPRKAVLFETKMSGDLSYILVEKRRKNIASYSSNKIVGIVNGNQNRIVAKIKLQNTCWACHS